MSRSRTALSRFLLPSLWLLAALFALPLASASTKADETPTEDFDHIITLRRKLLNPVTLAPVECRLDEALVRLANETGVMIHVDWKRLEATLKPEQKVMLKAKDAVAIEVIQSLFARDDHWLPLTETGLHVLEERDPGPFVTRRYDLRPLIGARQPVDALDDVEIDPESEMMTQLAELVVDVLGDRKDWIIHGGRRWQITRDGTCLTLGMTLRMHEDCLRLLGQLSAGRGGLDVYLECQAMEWPEDGLKQVLKAYDVETKGNTAIATPDVAAILRLSTQKMDRGQ
ncbi:MAG: hypothetical protein WD768_11280 [Phycisphaeraceae bacterium]